jgi:uncharacterized membrane protein YcaP (DUF421 family)
MVMGFIVYFVISSKVVPVLERYIFFVTITAIHIGTCHLMLKGMKQKEKIFSKSYLIFQNGQFYKGIMVQSKVTEREIRDTLKIKGITDMSQIESIILETDGELTVIFKEKVKTAA